MTSRRASMKITTLVRGAAALNGCILGTQLSVLLSSYSHGLDINYFACGLTMGCSISAFMLLSVFVYSRRP